MPLAMLFFEPQNTMAISSSREKPNRRLAIVVATMIAPSMTASIARIAARSIADTSFQTPATMPALKAA